MTMQLSGTTGIVLPTAAAPAMSAYSNTNQSLSSSSWTKVILNTEVFDTANCFDSTTNYRFTPNIGGYYQVNYQVSALSGTNTAVIPAIYKNGTSYCDNRQYATGAILDDWVVSGSVLLYLNGSTDYIELWTYVVGTATLNGSSSGRPDTSSRLDACLVRSA